MYSVCIKFINLSTAKHQILSERHASEVESSSEDEKDEDDDDEKDEKGGKRAVFKMFEKTGGLEMMMMMRMRMMMRMMMMMMMMIHVWHDNPILKSNRYIMGLWLLEEFFNPN